MKKVFHSYAAKNEWWLCLSRLQCLEYAAPVAGASPLPVVFHPFGIPLELPPLQRERFPEFLSSYWHSGFHFLHSEIAADTADFISRIPEFTPTQRIPFPAFRSCCWFRQNELWKIWNASPRSSGNSEEKDSMFCIDLLRTFTTTSQNKKRAIGKSDGSFL